MRARRSLAQRGQKTSATGALISPGHGRRNTPSTRIRRHCEHWTIMIFPRWTVSPMHFALMPGKGKCQAPRPPPTTCRTRPIPFGKKRRKRRFLQPLPPILTAESAGRRKKIFLFLPLTKRREIINFTNPYFIHGSRKQTFLSSSTALFGKKVVPQLPTGRGKLGGDNYS